MNITTGLASVEIEVPETMAAKIASDSFIGGLDVGNGFTKHENAFSDSRRRWWWRTGALIVASGVGVAQVEYGLTASKITTDGRGYTPIF